MLRRWLSRFGLAALAATAWLAAAAYAAQGGPAPVEITVIVPADAEVFFDGTKTMKKGTNRKFVTPPLAAGRNFSYELRAKWKVGTDEFDVKRKVRFKAGDKLTVDFTKPEDGDTKVKEKEKEKEKVKEKEKEKEKEPVKEKSLYERLGGEKTIAAVVEDLMKRVGANPKVNVTRKGTGKEFKLTPEKEEHLKKQLIDFIGEKTGGPQKYEGPDMKTAHKGMKITNKEFDAMAADLIATLDKFKVPAKEQAEVLKLIGSTRKDIVEETKGTGKANGEKKQDKEKKGDEESRRGPGQAPNEAARAETRRLEAGAAAPGRRPDAILSRE